MTDSAPHTWTYFEEGWHPGQSPDHGAADARGLARQHRLRRRPAPFGGATPDLDRHMQRVNASATSFLLDPIVPVARWMDLAREGIARFEPGAELYIRPMYWPEHGAAGGGVRFDPASTRWCLSIYRAPMPAPTGMAITLSPFRRPTIECAPVEAKAGCLYPNGARALIEAYKRGFGNCVMRDMLGNVAELANSNIFMVKDHVVLTPVPNGTFLDGVTRQRIIALLEADGITVRQQTLTYAAFETADEIFATGNFSKVAPVTRLDEKSLPVGPITQRARDLYWAFAKAGKSVGH